MELSEAIFLLKRIKKIEEKSLLNNDSLHDKDIKKEIQAMETVLQALEEYENQMDLDYVDKNYIRKDKIKEKIEEIKEVADEDNMDEFVKINLLEGLLKGE